MRAIHSTDHDHDYNDETILGWDRDRSGGGLLTDQGDLWGLPTGARGKPSPALVCLLVFCIVMATVVAVQDTSRIADQQKAAGQLVGYRNTAPLSKTAPVLSSSSENAISGYSVPLGGVPTMPLDEVLIGVKTTPRITPTTATTTALAAKESR